MPILDHPTAQQLLADAELSADDLRGCTAHLDNFLLRYLPRFYRVEQHELARILLHGKLSTLQRKTSEPIAALAHRPRKPLQHFVGAGAWDDQAVLTELRRHVAEQLPCSSAVLVLDPSSFPKKGNASCGVGRQWCGRLGKIENCQVGVFVAYVTPEASVLVDAQLYLPAEWAADADQRQTTHVPENVRFAERWRIGLEMIERCRRELRFGWVVGDDEFGRCSEFRSELRQAGLRYVLDVPSNTRMRIVGQPPPEGCRMFPWMSVADWATLLPASSWDRIELPGGSAGPRVVQAAEVLAQTRDSDGNIGKIERMVVIRTLDHEPEVWYATSNASVMIPLGEVVHAQRRRHGVEVALEHSKGEVGMAEYEVRSWVGWHHHMTLTLLASWFLVLERNRLQKKSPR